MEIAALIWEKTAFFAAMIDAPEAVRALAHKIHDLLVAFLDEWFSRYGTNYVAHYPDYYMPRGLTLSEDEVGSVSSDMFQEFFLPELNELSGRYGGLGIHSCANARHQWENFLKVRDLMLLNLVQGSDVLREAYAFFGPHTAQMHGWHGDGSPAKSMASYPTGARVVVEVTADTREQAVQQAAALRALCP